MNRLYILFLFALMLVLFVANLIWGSVTIPLDAFFNVVQGETVAQSSWQTIIIHSRLPQSITALTAGASLALAGLLLQSLFSNPLAGPSILGIDAGASLGVAIAMLVWGSAYTALPTWLQALGNFPIIIAAFIGSLFILGILVFFSSFIKSNLTLLIIGIMFGYFTSASISMINYFADAQGVQAFTLWGMGDFSGVSLAQIPYFSGCSLIAIIAAFLYIKPLNSLLLGDRYAQSLGINTTQLRIILLLITGILTANATAYCGPISFIGLVVPHMARLMLRSSNHKLLLPATCLMGANLSLICNLISNFPGSTGVIPLNTITPIIGAPIILYVILFQRKIEYFN